MNTFTPGNDDQWAAARARSAQVRGTAAAAGGAGGYGPTIQTKNEGFFQRSRRKISATLPTFHNYGPKTPHDWREAEKLGRGRWRPGRRGDGGVLDSCKTFVGNVLRKFRVVLILLACVVGVTVLWSKTGKLIGTGIGGRERDVC